METDAQSGKTRFGAPDGPRQNHSKTDRREPLEFLGHETVAQFLATPKSQREFKSITALARHFNITRMTVYCWMNDIDVMRRVDWLSMQNKEVRDRVARREWPDIMERLVERAKSGDTQAAWFCADRAWPEDQQAKKSGLSTRSLNEVLAMSEEEHEKHGWHMTPKWLRERDERRKSAERKAAGERPASEDSKGPIEQKRGVRRPTCGTSATRARYHLENDAAQWRRLACPSLLQ